MNKNLISMLGLLFISTSTFAISYSELEEKFNNASEKIIISKTNKLEVYPILTGCLTKGNIKEDEYSKLFDHLVFFRSNNQKLDKFNILTLQDGDGARLAKHETQSLELMLYMPIDDFGRGVNILTELFVKHEKYLTSKFLNRPGFNMGIPVDFPHGSIFTEEELRQSSDSIIVKVVTTQVAKEPEIIIHESSPMYCEFNLKPLLAE